jgi:hypothetical protein
MLRAQRGSGSRDRDQLSDAAAPRLPYQTRTMQALGLDFAVESDDPRFIEHVERLFVALPDGRSPTLTARWTASSHTTGRVRVEVGDALAMSAGRPGHAVTSLLWHLNRAVVAASTSRWLLIHAAAARRDASFVVLAAPTESGKSTTVAGLVQSGWSYVTDEMVAVDRASLTVTPYPRPMCLDPGSWPVLADLHPCPTEYELGQWHVPPTRAAEPGTPTIVVFPAYRRGARSAMEPIRPAEAVRLLVESTFGFLDAPTANLTALASLVRGARCRRLVIGRLSDAVRLLDELVAEHAPTPTIQRGRNT